VRRDVTTLAQLAAAARRRCGADAARVLLSGGGRPASSGRWSATMRANAIVPILAGGRVEGVLTIARRSRRAFSPRDRRVLDELATRAAAAIARTRQARGVPAFRAMIEHSLDAFALVDARGAVLYANQGAVRLLGGDLEAALTWSVSMLVHPDDVRRLATWVTELLATPGNQRHGVLRCRHADGSWRWLEGTASNLLHEPGVEAIVVNVRDVTERRRAEEGLLKSQERFLLAARATNDAVWDWDLRTDEVWWNDGIRSLFGYGHDGVTPHVAWWSEHIHPHDHERVIGSVQAVLATGEQSWSAEYRFRRADGGYAEVFDRAYVLFDEGGRPRRMIGAMMDISERKRAEEALRETSRMLRALIESSPLPILAVDRDCRVQLWNDAATRVFGWTEDEVLGRFLPTVPAEEREAFAELLGRYVRGHTARTYETRRVRKDGRPIDVLVSPAVLVDEAGAVVGAMAVIDDVTERRYLEEQLRQSQKLEAVGRLAGGIAHDFNNLLTVITGRARLAQRRLPAGDAVRADIELIARTGERAATLTQQLLAFSRKQVLQPRVVDLNAVVAGMGAMLRRLIPEDIDLVLRPGPDLWRVRADPGQIEQVITNLALNARDAMPSGGRLEIETANVRLDDPMGKGLAGVPPGSYVTLVVGDTGVGIEPTMLDRIFEPFFTTKEIGKGTGLGLAMVYGIVKQHDGAIAVASEPDAGSIFTVYLPRVDAEVPEGDGAGAASAPPQGTATVLLVEDETGVRQLAQDVLEDSGYTVLAASRPSEALALAEEHSAGIDLLVTDVVMPEMSGRQLADHLAGRCPGLRILYMSGYTDDAIVRHGVLDPGTSLLAKPFQPDDLVRLVHDVLRAR
jgi:PAS domain S-box-containing protein